MFLIIVNTCTQHADTLMANTLVVIDEERSRIVFLMH